jgi:hypothetical protein
MLLFLWLVVGSYFSLSAAATYPIISTFSVGIGGQQQRYYNSLEAAKQAAEVQSEDSST